MKLDIKVYMNGHEIFYDQVESIEYERNKHVLHEMKALGASVKNNGQDLSDSEIDALSQTDARRVNVATRSQYSASELENLYHDKIALSDQMWKDINKDFKMGDPMKAGVTEFEVHGVDPQVLAQGLSPDAAANGNAETEYETNPEHFIMTGHGDNGLHVMETFGMYGEPTNMFVNVVKEGDLNINLPIKREPDYPILSVGNPVLASDGSEINNIPFHQFKPLPDGIKIKGAIFVPKAAPDEIVSGHQWHLAIESWEQMRLLEKNS
ncbi:hypothetical protein OZX56_06200 [Lactobacillus sp. ESL0684]|uniref:hypothetical protein n=1 Tax=Lactobacillus sp. ESL0684 TaxID=2983213 RepID=UPI0023F899C1|nr:hypothetical protein [Lactobacillus sp. ESL0684]WEV43136.1 hypothetical protein OZX56_06200 [Lactobacillus sp. ESL0684]